jgi:hypothetical protein
MTKRRSLMRSFAARDRIELIPFPEGEANNLALVAS